MVDVRRQGVAAVSDTVSLGHKLIIDFERRTRDGRREGSCSGSVVDIWVDGLC